MKPKFSVGSGVAVGLSTGSISTGVAPAYSLFIVGAGVRTLSWAVMGISSSSPPSSEAGS